MAVPRALAATEGLSELGEDRPQRADARREGVAIVLDDIVKLLGLERRFLRRLGLRRMTAILGRDCPPRSLDQYGSELLTPDGR